MKLRAPDPKIKLTRDQLDHFCRYLDKCKKNGFIGINNYNRHAKDREELYAFTLERFHEKCLLKLMANFHKTSITKLSVTVDFAEQKTVCAMFQRVDCDSYLLSIQQTILQQLKPVLNYA